MRPRKGYLRHKLAGNNGSDSTDTSTEPSTSTESSSKLEEGTAFSTDQDQSLLQLSKNFDKQHQQQQQHQALQKSFPFHNSDMTGLDSKLVETEIASSMEVCPPLQQQQSTKIPLGLSNKANIGPGAATNKIRLDPVLQIVYFDTAQSRRAFSLVRTNETSPDALLSNKVYGNSYNGSKFGNTYGNSYGNNFGNVYKNGQNGIGSQTEKWDRPTQQHKRKRRNSVRLRRIVKTSRLSTAATTTTAITNTTSASMSSTRAVTATAKSSGSLHSAPNSSTPNSYGSPIETKPILRSKVNTNSAAEMERLMVLSEERRQQSTRRLSPGSGVGFGGGGDSRGGIARARGFQAFRSSQEQEEEDEEEESMATHLQSRQYPRGTRSSVKELYSAMRMAQVEGYEMRM